MSVYISIRRKDPSIPWGFKLQGGLDFNQPLTIAGVSSGGISQLHGLRAGDKILSIGGDMVDSSWTHQRGQQAVIRCGNELSFEVLRGVPMPIPHVSKKSLNLSNNPTPAAHNGGYSTGFNQKPYTPRTDQPSSNFMSGTLKHIMEQANNPSMAPHPSIFNPQPPPSVNTNSDSEFAYKPQPVNLGPKPTPVKFNGPTNSGPSKKTARLENPGAGKSTPVCYHCKQDITGPFVVALDLSFCPDHFTCSICNKNMKHDEFIEEDGRFYCEKDFAENKAEKCAACHQVIIGTIISALEKKWHNDCFVCSTCRKPIGQSVFHTGDDGKVYCEPHFKKAYEITCEKCKKEISEIDRFMEVFDKVFHASCFQCAACNVPLEGKPFHPRDGKAFCKTHAFASAVFS